MSVDPASTIVLPEGVKVGPPRETSQVDAQGQVTQGMVFPIRLAGGGTTSVYIPYSLINDTAYVQRVFEERVAAVAAITG